MIGKVLFADRRIINIKAALCKISNYYIFENVVNNFVIHYGVSSIDKNTGFVSDKTRIFIKY